MLNKAPKRFEERARYDDVTRHWGSSSGPSFSTTVVSDKTGNEQRMVNWMSPLGTFDIGNRNVRYKDYQKLLSFFHIMRGKASGFRIRDWSDYSDDGMGVLRKRKDGKYQMYKKRTYDYIDDAYYQKIIKPLGPSWVATDLRNTIRIFYFGDEMFMSSTPGGYQLDDTTGQATVFEKVFIGSATNNIITTQENHDLKVGYEIEYNDVVYKVIRIINDTQVEVDKTSLDLQNVEFKYYFGNGLTWTGYFDKPVRFDQDDYIPQVIMFVENGDKVNPETQFISLPSIKLIELRIKDSGEF